MTISRSTEQSPNFLKYSGIILCLINLPKPYFCPKATFFLGWKLQCALLNFCFNSKDASRFHWGLSTHHHVRFAVSLLVHLFLAMFLYEMSWNCFKTVSPPLFIHNWKNKVHCVTVQWHMSIFRKCLKKVDRTGDGCSRKEMEKQEKKPSSRMKISLETMEIKHSPCSLKTGQEKNQVHFQKRCSRINIRRNFLIIQTDEF